MGTRLGRRTKMFAREVGRGDLVRVAGDVARWTWSTAEACGLRFTEGDQANPPPCDVPLTARPLDPELAEALFDVEGLAKADQFYIDARRAMWDDRIDGGWVAVTPEGEPAYLQWLVPPADHPKVRAHFGELFPTDPDTLVVEGAWVPPSFRKRKAMGEGLARVTAAALEAAPSDVVHALCFPASDNKGAVLGTASAGYTVVMRRTERWRLGRRSVAFEKASSADFEVLNRSS